MNPSRRVFLTGATGFIGARLAGELARRGWSLRCLARPTSNTETLEALGAELVRGDVTDADVLDAALCDVELAYHLAGLYDLGAIDAEAMERVNVAGTAAFLGAVASSGVPRAVHVSTTIALGPVRHGLGDESTTHDDVTRSAYERTKLAAHRFALEAQREGLPVIIACPAAVYGPGDDGPNGRFIRDLMRHRLPGLLTAPAWLSYVHVDDVAEGLARVGESGRVGETYVLSGEPATVNQFANRVMALAGGHAPRLRFPPVLARFTTRLLDPVLRLAGSGYSFNGENVDTTSRLRWLHAYDKAQRELGYHPRPLEEGLPETVAWFATHP